MIDYKRCIIPLRTAFETAPHTKRAPKAIKVIKEYVKRHGKIGTKHPEEDQIVISNGVNELIWKHGIRNIPRKIEVILAIDKKLNKVFVYLPEEVSSQVEGEKNDENKESER
jgi:large subunit ribosomal protein L31e